MISRKDLRLRYKELKIIMQLKVLKLKRWYVRKKVSYLNWQIKRAEQREAVAESKEFVYDDE